MGRPSTYTPDMGERICALIAQGKSKRQIEGMEGFPARETIDVWVLRHEDFAGQYARACEARAEGFAEELVEIADRADLPADQKRVMVDTRKWVASRILPKQYGEKAEVTHRGSIGSAPAELTREQILQRLSELDAKAGP